VNCTETPVRHSSSSRQKNIVHVESISPLARADKQERKCPAKTSHAAELTSSPYKRALEATKAQASASRPRPEKRDAKKVLDVKAKQQKLSKKMNNTENQKLKSSKPKSVKKYQHAHSVSLCTLIQVILRQMRIGFDASVAFGFTTRVLNTMAYWMMTDFFVENVL